jgi:hypothetical protein
VNPVAMFTTYLVHYIVAREVWREIRRGTEAASLTVYVVVAACGVLIAFGWRRHRYRYRYRAVLRSRRWKRLRRRVYRRSGGRCERCCRRHFLGGLQLHHRTYARLGRERMTDVELLCDECHKSEHRCAA